MYTITRSITLKCGEKVNVKIIVKEEDRKVIAIVDEKICGDGYLKYLVKRVIYDFFNHQGLLNINFNHESKIGNILNLENYYRTIATCDPRDEWDEKIGINLVLNKMKNKLDTAVNNRLIIFTDKLHTDIEKFTIKFFYN